MTLVVGLLGGAGAGKSATARYLVEHYGAVRYHGADPMKRIVMRAFDLREEQVFGTQAEKEAIDPRYNVSGRWLCEHVGTDGIMSEFGDDVWIKMCLARSASDAPKLAVIENLRLVCDSVAVMAWNGLLGRQTVVWRLENPERETNVDANHRTEAEWSRAPYDFAIAPLHKGLTALHTLVDEACRTYRIFPVRRELSL